MGYETLGGRPGNGEAALFLPCERGSHRHTVVVARPRLSFALWLLAIRAGRKDDRYVWERPGGADEPGINSSQAPIPTLAPCEGGREGKSARFP